MDPEVLILGDETVQTGITQVLFKTVINRVSFRLN